jgi:hypothetical protein
MGYYMDQMTTVFCIKHENKEAALKAIKDLAGRETIEDSSGRHFSWVNTEAFLKAETLDDALKEWRWWVEVEKREPEKVDINEMAFDYDPEDIEAKMDIVGISFSGEKKGNDDIVFEAIAPYVEEDSFIEMSGEDGCTWRWNFWDGQLIETYPEVHWPEKHEIC